MTVTFIEIRASQHRNGFLGEVSGALGDSITVIPLVVAIAALTDLSVAVMLLGFGAFQVTWGLVYGVPISVEPMKALAALLIAGSLTTHEFAIAGLLAGAVLVLVSTGGVLGRFQDAIGRPVIRGIQLAVALVLLETGLGLGAASASLAIGAVVLVAVLALWGRHRTAPLVIVGVGALMAGLQTGPPSLTVPTLSIAHLSGDAVRPGPVLGATAGQLAMTAGNAAVATSLLLSDYFEADISPDSLARSMGVMTLIAVPLGMLPMCHGSGGLAGKYAFGARTPIANLVLGGFYALIALTATGLVMAFPMALLGVVLVVIALQLGRTSLRSDRIGLTLLVGVLGGLTSIGIGFAAGVLLWMVYDRLGQH